MLKTATTIIGGGLSGLHTAFELHRAGRDFILVEARDRVGGRILSVHHDSNQTDLQYHGYDLGPAWFWPGQQRMLSLIDALELTDDVFLQHADGDAVYQDHSGKVQRFQGGITMAGSYRLRGGIARLTNQLAASLPVEKRMLGKPATTLQLQHDSIQTIIGSGDEQQTIESQQAVLALPPRVACAGITFSPVLPRQRRDQLEQVATWMAGQAKFVALYEQPFWRAQGLSGDAMSQCGPMHEIHDASPPEGGPYALFGFIGIPAANRQGASDQIKQNALSQLSALFGPTALKPISVHFKDWAFDKETAVKLDHAPLRGHPTNYPGELIESGWQQRLLWSGTETATTHTGNNGYLEGALEASERSLKTIIE